MPEQRFVDLVLSGHADPEDLDDFIDRWHDGDSPRPLHAYLGFSREEWGLIVSDSTSLRIVFAARDGGVRLDDARRLDQSFALAARSRGIDEDEFHAWTRRHGLES